MQPGYLAKRMEWPKEMHVEGCSLDVKEVDVQGPEISSLYLGHYGRVGETIISPIIVWPLHLANSCLKSGCQASFRVSLLLSEVALKGRPLKTGRGRPGLANTVSKSREISMSVCPRKGAKQYCDTTGSVVLVNA